MMEYGEFLLTSTSYRQTVVYEQRGMFIGGYSLWASSYVISELELTPRATMKKLSKMPEERNSHGVEIFEDKVLILGGDDDF